MMQKALQNIKLPYPADVDLQGKAKYDKISAFINENFKTVFDGVDELTTNMKTQEKLEKMMKELTTTMAEINAKLDQILGGS